MCDYGNKDTTCAWHTSFSILLDASNKVLSLQNECWQLQKAFSLSPSFFFFFFFVLPLILLPITFQLFGTCLKMKWFHRPGLRSSSLCFESQEVYSTECWLLECFHLALTSRELSESGGASVKNLLPVQETQETRVWLLRQEDALEKETATHSSILDWKIPWTEKPGGLQSMGSQRDTAEHTHTHAHTHNWMSRILNVDRLR